MEVNRKLEATELESHVSKNVFDKLKELGQSLDDQFAVLPENLFDTDTVDEFVFSGSIVGLRKLFRESGLDVSLVGGSQPTKTEHCHSVDWIAPTLFVTTMYLTEHPDAVNVAIGVIANYATELLGRGGGSVKLDVFVQDSDDSHSVQVKYTGPPAGLPDAQKIVREASKHVRSKK